MTSSSPSPFATFAGPDARVSSPANDVRPRTCSLNGNAFTLEPLAGVLSVFKVTRAGSGEALGYVQHSPRCAIPLRSARMESDACIALLLRVLAEAEKTRS